MRRFYENHERPVDLSPDIATPRAKSGDRGWNVFSQAARVVDCGQVRYGVLGRLDPQVENADLHL